MLSRDSQILHGLPREVSGRCSNSFSPWAQNDVEAVGCECKLTPLMTQLINEHINSTSFTGNRL